MVWMTKPRTRYNRRQGQGFIGIRSGLTGETVIMLPVWSNVPGQPRDGELRIRLAADRSVEEDVLGTVRYIEDGVWIPHVCEADGTRTQLDPVIGSTDAAMDILQYLSDACDPRVHLEHHANALDTAQRPPWPWNR